MPDLARRWTREEVLALPDDGAIAPFVAAHGLGETLWSPADLDLGSGQVIWRPNGAPQPLELDLPELFHGIWGS